MVTEVNIFAQASSLLGLADNTLDVALSYIKSQCIEDGKVAPDKIDEHQLVCYELAFCKSELVAAREMLSYAERVRSVKSLTSALSIEERMALVYSAEALQNSKNRISAHQADFGQTTESLQSGLFSEEVTHYCGAQLKAANLAELGQALIDLNGSMGDYLLDDEKELMRESFRQFATNVIRPLAEDIHRNDADIPDTIIKPLIELGLFGICVPERFGGIQPDEGEDNLGMIVVTEELSRGSLCPGGGLITRPEILTRAIMAGGTQAQKEHWLPKLAVGNPLSAVAITEPDCGSDVAAVKLKATKVDGGYLLNGTKTWCTFAGQAGVLLCLARTNPDMRLGHKGLSLFLVEKPSGLGHKISHDQESGGQLSGQSIPTIGYRGMHSFDLFFDDYFVSDSNLIGGEDGLGKGFYYTMAGFSGGRIQTAARACGVMQAAYDCAVRYAQERKVFGKLVSDYQLTQVKIAQMATRLATCRQFTYSVGRLMDEGKGRMEASLVKLYSCKTSEWLCREAMQIHGGMGYAEESAVSRYFVDSRVLSIFEGAEETLALKVIARSLVENAA